MARELGFQLEEKQKELEIVMKDNKDLVRDNNELRKNLKHVTDEYYKGKSEPHQLRTDKEEAQKLNKELESVISNKEAEIKKCYIEHNLLRDTVSESERKYTDLKNNIKELL